MPTEVRQDVPTLQTFYTNNIGVEATPFDVTLKLGLVHATTPELVTVHDVAKVYLSHEHFKSLVAVLTHVLERLQTPVGPPPTTAGPRAFLG